jgi:hypothetical protein
MSLKLISTGNVVQCQTPSLETHKAEHMIVRWSGHIVAVAGHNYHVSLQECNFGGNSFPILRIWHPERLVFTLAIKEGVPPYAMFGTGNTKWGSHDGHNQSRTMNSKATCSTSRCQNISTPTFTYGLSSVACCCPLLFVEPSISTLRAVARSGSKGCELLIDSRPCALPTGGRGPVAPPTTTASLCSRGRRGGGGARSSQSLPLLFAGLKAF